MQKEILDELRRSNELSEWIVYLLCVIVILWLIRGAAAVIGNWKKIKKDSRREVARELYQEEKYYDLIEFCEKKLRTEPKDLNSLYWKAKAEYKTGLDEDMNHTLSVLLDLAPRWKEDWMDQYILKKVSQQDASSNSADAPR